MDLNDPTVKLLARILSLNHRKVFFPLEAWSPELRTWWKEYRIQKQQQDEKDAERYLY